MFPSLVNMLSWWQWLILIAIPPLVILLYFLKLRRRPVEVPSTYLWHKSIEDLHVNSVWQRLRRNLLLMLQLLALALLMLALLRPGWRGAQLAGKRFIFLVDNSASMQASDQDGSRLDEAKRRVGQLIDQMRSGDAAMIISFADAARVEQMFTDNRQQLRRSLAGIRPTPRSTSISEALKAAAGLANPGRSAESVSDFQVAEPLPAKLFILSDGRFPDVPGFSLGNLEPVFIPIGRATASNVGIIAFSTRRKEAQPDLLQAFARLENFSSQAVTVTASLRMDGRLLDAAEVKIPAGGSEGVAFDLREIDSGTLSLEVSPKDDLVVDNQAWAPLNPPRRARVLLITPGNEPLQLALGTAEAAQAAEVSVQPPEFLKTREYTKAAAGALDLVIYDRCQPKEMPAANTLWIGALPPGSAWGAKPKVVAPQIIDTDPAHPLMQWLNLGDVLVAEATPLVPPAGTTRLIDSDAGTLLAIAPREGFEDAVLGLVIVDQSPNAGPKAQQVIGTNWPIRPSFPTFVFNLLDYFGGRQTAGSSENVRPGRSVIVDQATTGATMSVRTPGGKEVPLEQTRPGKLSFSGTDDLGDYAILSGGKIMRRFAVNLFDPAESNIPPRSQVEIGYVKVAAQSGWEVIRRETWKALLLTGLVVLVVEWYIYSRRVYL